MAVPLVIVNPSPNPRRKAKAKPKTARRVNPQPKATKAKPKGASMKKRRSAAQKAATARMIAANKRHRNPSPAKHYRRRRTSNPSPVKFYRRRRNPSSSGTGDLFKEMFTKDFALQAAAVAGVPTLTQLLIGQLAPTSTGYARVAMKAGIGIALAYAASKFVNRKLGMTVGVVTVGMAATELIQQYQANSVVTVKKTEGYLGRLPGGMQGYIPGNVLPPRQSEPGVVRF